MCELLALSSSRPARLSLSLRALASHGDMDGVAPDGWGVAFYAGHDVALFREPVPAAHSPLVQYLEDQGPRTQLAISHIRHATHGAVSLANTQPFVRELGGRSHVFAHNGHLPGIWDNPGFSLGTDRPVGETDSEQACCVLLGRMRGLWRDGMLPALSDRLALLEGFAAELCTMGPANFLYADGDVLFAHGHRRIQRATGKVEPPGLWMLQSFCADASTTAVQSESISVATTGQSLVLVASVPLTADAWQPLTSGQIVVVREGRVITPVA